MSNSRPQNLRFPPPSYTPRRLASHVEFLESLRVENAESLSSVDPNSRRGVEIQRRLQTLDQEIAYFRTLYSDDQRIEQTRYVQRSQGRAEMSRGLGCLVVGALVSGLGYFLADPGDRFYIFWGAMAIGVIMFVRGLGKSREWW